MRDTCGEFSRTGWLITTWFHTTPPRSADTGVTQHIVAASCVTHRQLTSASRASQESFQQCLSILYCTRLLFSLRIRLNSPDDAFELFPTHISFMGPWDEGQPLFPWLAAAEGVVFPPS